MKNLLSILFLFLSICTNAQFQGVTPKGIDRAYLGGTMIYEKLVAEAGQYVINTTSNVSAGIYDSDDHLVRTLFSNVQQEAGTYALPIWDGDVEDVDGSLITAPVAEYTVKITSNNIQDEWISSGIGNTTRTSGGTSFRAINRPFGMSISANYLYVTVGYNEKQPSAWKVDLNNSNLVTPVLGEGSTDRFVWTDGTNVYWACSDLLSTNLDGSGNNVIGEYGMSIPNASFVKISKVSDDTEFITANSTPYDTPFGATFNSAINTLVDEETSPYITGISGQVTGNLLFVARWHQNTITVLNKTTGALVNTITSITSPRHITVSGNSLYAVHDAGVVSKYTFDSGGAITSTDFNITTLSYPYALAINAGTLSIADGGTSQQIKRFNATTGSATSTFGQAGGYYTSPTVAGNKFYFSDEMGFPDSYMQTKVSKFFNGSGIAFESDGSYWVTDEGNSRLMHLSSADSFIEEIRYIPTNRNVKLDPNDPTHLFEFYREHEIDYANETATLINNWGAKIPFEQDDENVRFSSLFTVDGRRFSAIHSAGFKTEIVELTSMGIRKTGVITTNNQWKIYADGMYMQPLYTNIGSPLLWLKKPYTGLDGSNNPTYGNQVNIAQTPNISAYDPIRWADGSEPMPNQRLSNGNFVSFDPRKKDMERGLGYHLGILNPVSSEWVARTAFTTQSNYSGPFPIDGGFDSGNGVQIAGNKATTIDNMIIWGYNGEFWKSGQTNKWTMVYENGLNLGNYGIVMPSGTPNPTNKAAGNANSSAFYKQDSNTIHMFNNDESYFGMVHWWKLTGINTIKTVAAPIAAEVVDNGPSVEEFADFDNTDYITENPEGTWIGNNSYFFYDGNIAVTSKKLPFNEDGYFQFYWDDYSNKVQGFIGLKNSPALEDKGSYAIGLGYSNTAMETFVGNSFTPLANIPFGTYVRFLVTGSQIKIQYSSDNATYTDAYTYPYTRNSDLYLAINFSQMSRFEDVKVFNFEN